MYQFKTIEDFYKEKFNWVPDNLKKEIGHFNVFRLEEFYGKSAKPVPYSRKDYYKVSLLVGKRKFHFANKTIEVKKQCLLFSSPQIPYNWEYLEEQQSGCFCVFTPSFFHRFGNLQSYAVFQPNGTHVFELSDAQLSEFTPLFERMFEEIAIDYEHKYDLLRTLVLDIVHRGMKLQPSSGIRYQGSNAAQRLSILFIELLERQFPVEETGQRFQFRSASDFARQLSIHVNHLNKALKETTGKTTSDIIAERVLQEAKILLKTSHWNISEIANTLGFTEVTHFNNFFKKKLNLSPTQFRND